MSTRTANVLVSLFMLFFLTTESYGGEKVVMKVYLNTEDKGEYFVMNAPDMGVLIKKDDLMKMGFASLPEEADGRQGDPAYALLGPDTPWARAEVDEKELAVRITASPALLRKNIIDVSFQRPPGEYAPAATSAFLNYSLGYAMDGDFDFASFTALAEAGLSVNAYLLMSNFTYVKDNDSGTFARGLTNLTRDDMNSQRRFVLGDFFAYSGALGGGAYLGGVSVAKNFGITPYFIKTSGLDLSGVLSTPSEVEVLVNGYPVSSERISPGEFELHNVYNATGGGNATVRIKDAYGRTEEYEVPFYISSALLKPGLSEYSYNIGLKRENVGFEDSDYSGVALAMYHNYGFTRNFTAGIRAEAAEDLVNAGASASVLAGRYGELSAAAAYSSSNGASGASGILSYAYAGRQVSAFASVNGFTKDYSNLALPAGTNKTRLNSTLSLGYNLERYGSVSATASRLDSYDGAGLTRYSAAYSKTVFRNVALHMTASRLDSDVTTHEFFAGLNFLLGSETSGGLSYRAHSGVSTETAFIQNSLPAGTGLGYRALAERTDAELGGNFNAQYNGRHGVYAADYRRVAGSDSYDLSTAGSVVFIDKGAHLGRPVNDAFALVKVGDAKGVKVSYSNQEIGETGSGGELLVPNLISYQDNSISIDGRDLPVNYSLSEVARNVVPLNRAGVVVSFKTTKLQGFGGRVFVSEDGARVPAEYGRLELKTNGAPAESVIGRGGEFYMENLPSGRFPAEVFYKRKRCSFSMEIPESADNTVDIGEVTCEMD